MHSSGSKCHVLAKILGITVFLFGVTAQLAAQGRSDELSLEGLRNILVVVKYGHVDGQEKEWQSNILQRLEERARQKLWEAEVPVFKSAEEAVVSDRPRLVFIVSLNQTTDTAPPVHVETELRQRVRLWRDSTKESELATWTMDGVGGAYGDRANGG